MPCTLLFLLVVENDFYQLKEIYLRFECAPELILTSSVGHRLVVFRETLEIFSLYLALHCSNLVPSRNKFIALSLPFI